MLFLFVLHSFRCDLLSTEDLDLCGRSVATFPLYTDEAKLAGILCRFLIGAAVMCI